MADDPSTAELTRLAQLLRELGLRDEVERAAEDPEFAGKFLHALRALLETEEREEASRPEALWEALRMSAEERRKRGPGGEKPSGLARHLLQTQEALRQGEGEAPAGAPAESLRSARAAALDRLLGDHREQEWREKWMEDLRTRPGLRTALQKAVDWLMEKWGPERTCPFCGVADWRVGSPLEVSVSSGHRMSPTFPVMCGNCGQTVYVNAIVAGIVPEPPKRPTGFVVAEQPPGYVTGAPPEE